MSIERENEGRANERAAGVNFLLWVLDSDHYQGKAGWYWIRTPGDVMTTEQLYDKWRATHSPDNPPPPPEPESSKELIEELEKCFLPHNLECDGAWCTGCWKDVVRGVINKHKGENNQGKH